MHAFLHNHPFLCKHAAKIQGVLSCFDRLIFRGYLPICHPKGLAGWMWSQGVSYNNFKHFAPQLAQRLMQHAKDMAQEQGRPYRHLPSPIPMEQEARHIAATDNIQEGLVCIYSCLETCRTFRLKYAPGKPRLEADLRRCQVLYYFFMDKECGLIHVKLHAWLPLTCQVYVNGHSWLEKQLDKQGIGYETIDNAFVRVADVEAAQRLADRFCKRSLRRLLHGWARRVNPLLGKELKGTKGAFSYYWVVDQAEYATDVMFKSRAELAPLYQALVEHASLCFSSVDVLRFFGRKPHPSLKLEVQSEKKRLLVKKLTGQGEVKRQRSDGVRVRHQLGRNRLKMYDKEGLVLRVETVINDPSQFRVLRRLGKAGWAHEGPKDKGPKDKHGAAMGWLPLRKNVGWLWRYAQVSLSANGRYLEALAQVEDPRAARDVLDRACRPQTFGKRRKRALEPLSPHDQALFLAVLRGENLMRGLTNRELAQQLYGEAPADEKERRRRGARVTRLIQLLRAHGLLAKVPHARRYRVTARGMALMSAAIYVKHKYLPRTIEEEAA